MVKKRISKALREEFAARKARKPKVLVTAHIPGPRRKPKFAYPEVMGDNLVEVGVGDEIIYKNIKGEVIDKNDEVACEDSAGPEAGAEDEAKTPDAIEQYFENPMKFGDVDG